MLYLYKKSSVYVYESLYMSPCVSPTAQGLTPLGGPRNPAGFPKKN